MGAGGRLVMLHTDSALTPAVLTGVEKWRLAFAV